MKNSFNKFMTLVVLALFLMSNSTNAQVPQKLNYQGIARDKIGNPISYQKLALKLSIIPSIDATVPEYEEIQNVTTNEFGLYTLQIGTGTVIMGDMKNVKWDTGNQYIHVAIDPMGGKDFVDAGITQLLSVPYAMYAEKAGEAREISSNNNHTRSGNVSTDIAGTGTINYITKFTAANTIYNSQLFDNGTNLGVGTTTPVAKLHINQNVAAVQEQLRMQNTNNNGAGRFTMYNDGNSSYATFTKYGTNVPGDYGASPLYPIANLLAFGNNGLANLDGKGRFLISSAGNIGISLYKSGLSKVKFHADYTTENVGIGGGESPVTSIHMNNDKTGDTLKITNNTTGHLANDGLDIRTTGDAVSIMNLENSNLAIGTNNTEVVNITPSGTTELSGQIKIAGGTPGVGKILTSDAVGLATWEVNGSGTANLNGTTNQLIKFTNANSGGDSRIYDDSIHIGIATNTPVADLHIHTLQNKDTLKLTNIISGQTLTDGLDIRMNGNAASIVNREASSLSFGTNDSLRVRIDAQGRVGINSFPNYPLQLENNQYEYSSVVYNNYSLGPSVGSGTILSNTDTTSLSVGILSSVTAHSGYGSENLLMGNTNGRQIGVLNAIINTGTGDHIGTSNLLSNTGNGLFIGTKNMITGNGDGMRYGTYDSMYGSGIGDQFGHRTFIPHTGNGSHYGTDNSFSGTGSGYHTGMINRFSAGSGNLTGEWNEFAGSIGNGNQIGMFNNYFAGGNGILAGSYTQIQNTVLGNGAQYGNYSSNTSPGIGKHYGTYNYLGGSGTGIQYGSYNQISSSNDTLQYGTLNIVNGSGLGYHYGISNQLTTAGLGPQYAVANTVNNTNAANSSIQYACNSLVFNAGTGSSIGYQAVLTNTGNGNQFGNYVYHQATATGGGAHYGLYNSDISPGGGIHIGSYHGLSSTGNGEQKGVYNEIDNSGTGIHYGIDNSLSGSGTGAQYGMKSLISNSSNGIHYGISNLLSGIGTGIHYGIDNTLSGTGTGAQYGVRSSITNSSNGIHYGVNNILSGVGSGIHYGVDNSLSGTGSGEQYGVRSSITNTSNGLHYGIRNSLSGSGSGVHNGTDNFLSGSGSGTQVGVISVISNSSNGVHYGTRNLILGNGSGIHYGIQNDLSGTGIGDQYAIDNSISNSGNGEHFGVRNNLSGSGSGVHYGMQNNFTGAGAGYQYGINNVFTSTGTGYHYGIYNDFSGNSASGTALSGLTNWIASTGNANMYGTSTTISSAATGTGIKYGNYVHIATSTGGTHYGIYSMVTKAGSYAGYFIGDVLISGELLPGTNSTSATTGTSIGSTTKRWRDAWVWRGVFNGSDIRLKTNIQNCTYGLKEVLALKPIKYNWKSEPDGRKEIGLVAQQVKELIPEVVETAKDSMQTLMMNYCALIPVLVKAIQEQQQLIKELQDANSNLKLSAIETNKRFKVLDEKLFNLQASLDKILPPSSNNISMNK